MTRAGLGERAPRKHATSEYGGLDCVRAQAGVKGTVERVLT